MSRTIAPLARMLGTAVLAAFSACLPSGQAAAQPSIAEKTMPYVRRSELEIDPTRLDGFETLAQENVRETRSGSMSGDTNCTPATGSGPRRFSRNPGCCEGISFGFGRLAKEPQVVRH
jgi:hypothetical protein